MPETEAPYLVNLGFDRSTERAWRDAATSSPQDLQPSRPRVTLINKAYRAEVEAAFRELKPAWSQWTWEGDRLILRRHPSDLREKAEVNALIGDLASVVTDTPLMRREG